MCTHSKNGPRDYYANKSERETQIVCDLSYMWNLKKKKKANKLETNGFIDSENKLVVFRK